MKLKVEGLHDRGQIVRWVLLSLLAMATLAVIVFSTVRINRLIDDDLESRVIDTGTIVDSIIEYRLDIYKKYVEDVASTLQNSDPNADLYGFLLREQKTSLFDGMFLVSEDMGILASTAQPGRAEAWLEEQRVFPEATSIASSTGEGIAFSASFQRNGQKVAIVGIRRVFSMNPASNDENYSDFGFSVIVDGEGDFVTLANGSVSRDVLDRWFTEDSERVAEHAVERAQAGDQDAPLAADRMTMSSGETGYVVSGRCSVDRWVLLTFVPETAFSQRAGAIVSYYWVAVSITVVCFLLIILTVVRTGRRATKRIEDALYVDSLTGGPTLAAFRKHAEHLMAENEGEPYFVTFLDIRGFKDVSELYGEDAAVKMIVAVYNALKRGVREDELLARCDRDRFFLMLHAHGPEFLQKRLNVAMRRIRRSPAARYFTGSFDIGEGACRVRDPEEGILILEDRAMRAASYCPPHGKCVFYRRDLEVRIERDLKLDQAFSDSLKAGDFKVYLQPKISLADDQVSSAEALVRWFHPELGQVSPAEFIPLFERNRKVCQLDRYVFSEVCRTLAEWNKGELPGVRVSVNMSRVCLLECGIDLVCDMKSICDLFGVPTSQIEIEITESVALDQYLADTVSEAIAMMHEFGFTCSIDDFGSGYSSLATLKDFEADTVKLDRAFFVDINERGWLVVQSFMRLAEELGINVVAEGIETAGQMMRLRELRCGFVQGYFCARPMSVDDYLEWEKVRLRG